MAIFVTSLFSLHCAGWLTRGIRNEKPSLWPIVHVGNLADRTISPLEQLQVSSPRVFCVHAHRLITDRYLALNWIRNLLFR